MTQDPDPHRYMYIKWKISFGSIMKCFFKGEFNIPIILINIFKDKAVGWHSARGACIIVRLFLSPIFLSFLLLLLQGGGIPRHITDQLFHYLFSTAPRPSMTPTKAPLAGYGYGLPLSRLYARSDTGMHRCCGSDPPAGLRSTGAVPLLATQSILAAPATATNLNNFNNNKNLRFYYFNCFQLEVEIYRY